MAVNKFRISVKEKVGILANLSTMLSAGIPLLDAVDSTSKDIKGNSKKLLLSVRTDIVSGKHIHEAFAQFPNVFDTITINLLKAAEESGTLETTLKDLKEHIQKDAEFVDKLKLAMVYPVIIGCVFVGVMLVMLLFVVPKISVVFSRLNVPLPTATKVMIFLSQSLTQHPFWSILTSALIGGAFVMFWKWQRNAILRMIFKMPVISSLIKTIDATRFTHTMHLLLRSGIAIDQSLELCTGVVFQPGMKKTIQHTKKMVMSGKTMTEGFIDQSPTLPSTALKLIEAGEKSGTLDKTLNEIAIYLDYETQNALKTATSVMEPIMLLIVGVGVGGMMVAIIAPIYGLIGQVNSRV